jgi:hypothetical protein
VTEILAPGNGIFFMRVGTHARETLDEIVARKLGEIDRVGYTFWGYGGNTCHPMTIVQPFAQERAAEGNPVYICMEEMESASYFGEPQAAAEYSQDGRAWHAVPEQIAVRGSRYALRIEDLRTTDFTLPLEHTRVRVGTSSGRLGSRFVAGAIDKACLVFEPGAGPAEPGSHRKISLVARVCEPYAMLLRNFREPSL